MFFFISDKSPNKLVHLDHAQLSNKNPIHIPGNETVSIDVQVLQPISGLHYRAELTVLKKLLFGYVVVPCFEDPSKNSWYVVHFVSEVTCFENKTF